MKKHLPILIIAILLALVGYQANNLISAQQQLTAYQDQPAPEPVCTTLECEVDRRTEIIFERDKGEYMEQSRLKALHELNQEMQSMTMDPEKRLNK